MPDDLKFKIKTYIEKNFDELYGQVDESIFVLELPSTLQDEIFHHRFHHLIDSFDFLRTCEDRLFVK